MRQKGYSASTRMQFTKQLCTSIQATRSKLLTNKVTDLNVRYDNISTTVMRSERGSNSIFYVLSWAKETAPFFWWSGISVGSSECFRAGKTVTLALPPVRYACVTTCALRGVWPITLAILPVLESKSRATNRNSASLKKKGVPFLLLMIAPKHSFYSHGSCEPNLALTNSKFKAILLIMSVKRWFFFLFQVPVNLSFMPKTVSLVRWLGRHRCWGQGRLRARELKCICAY